MKKKSSLPSPSAIAEIDTQAFSKVFQLKKGILKTVAALPDKEVIAHPFKSEAELASLVVGNRAVLFGERIIGLSGRLDNASFPLVRLVVRLHHSKATMLYAGCDARKFASTNSAQHVD